MGLDSVFSDVSRSPYAGTADYLECQKLHRKFGTTYYFASRFFPASVRRKVHALYGFVRLPDEWVDNPDCPRDEVRRRLDCYRKELIDCFNGICPTNSVLRAFADVVHECNMPLEEPLEFLRSMEQDLDKCQYATYRELQGYMRGSASSVGVMMCYILFERANAPAIPFAMALGEAMQMTNFLRDVREDAERGRIYLPQEHLARFEIPESLLLAGPVTTGFKDLMRFEIAETRKLYKYADEGIHLLPGFAQKPVRLASRLYERILSRIEAAEYDVFSSRMRTSKAEKLIVAARVLAGKA